MFWTLRLQSLIEWQHFMIAETSAKQMEQQVPNGTDISIFVNSQQIPAPDESLESVEISGFQ